jgi:mRNA-degrading endonuclease YafQ of YafQ-DinJ toxin-antitoxin module
MNIKIHAAKQYIKSFKKLSKEIQILLIEREKIFIANPYDSRLKTHRLSGKLLHVWSYSVNYHYRILFKFINKQEVIYLDVGTHEVYR